MHRLQDRSTSSPLNFGLFDASSRQCTLIGHSVHFTAHYRTQQSTAGTLVKQLDYIDYGKFTGDLNFPLLVTWKLIILSK